MTTGRIQNEIKYIYSEVWESSIASASFHINGTEKKLIVYFFGPVGTPYESGIFSIECKFPDTYPFKAPEVMFVTPILHPNVDSKGKMWIPKIEKWSPLTKISDILLYIVGFMNSPDFEKPLNLDLAKHYEFDSEEWLDSIKYFTLMNCPNF